MRWFALVPANDWKAKSTQTAANSRSSPRWSQPPSQTRLARLPTANTQRSRTHRAQSRLTCRSNGLWCQTIASGCWTNRRLASNWVRQSATRASRTGHSQVFTSPCRAHWLRQLRPTSCLIATSLPTPAPPMSARIMTTMCTRAAMITGRPAMTAQLNCM